MSQSDIIRKVDRSSRAASRERLLSPQMIQKTKAVRYPRTGIPAKITESLRRADETEQPPVEAIEHYKIQLLSGGGEDLDAWVSGYAGENLLETVPWFQVDDVVKVEYRVDKWWILETVTRVEITKDEVIYCSIAWNAGDNRAMGVF